MYCLRNILFFDIPFLYCYSNLNSSITCCLFSGDKYLPFGISVAFSSAFKYISFECNFFGDFETLVILSSTLLLIKSPVASAIF